MRTKNVKPFLMDHYIHKTLLMVKSFHSRLGTYLYAGEAIGIFIADSFAPRGKQPRYNRSALTLHLLEY